MPTISLVNPTGVWYTAPARSSVARNSAGFGDVNSGNLVGGNTGSRITTHERFNGSSWSTLAAVLPVAKDQLAACGTSSAGLAAGGYITTAVSSTTDIFNGSTWSNVSGGNFQAYGARYNHVLYGVQNAAMTFAGWNSSGELSDSYKKMEFFNGSTWSVGAVLFNYQGSGNTYGSYAGAGTQNSALAFGGQYSSGPISINHYWNGSTWTTKSSAPGSRMYHSGFGTSSSAVSAGGYDNFNRTTSTYKYDFASNTWITSGNMNVANMYSASFGLSTSGMTAHGTNSAGTTVTSVDRYASGDPDPLSVVEPVLSNTSIGTLSSAEAGMVFTLVSGTGSTDNGSFSISGTDLSTLVDLDYETKNSYSIRINATNGTTTYQNVLVINILDVAEYPTNITLSSNSITENNSINDVIGTLAAVDQDGAPHTFSIVSGSDKFNISGSSLRASVVFDYEEATSHSVTVRATDSASLTYDKVFTIYILNSTADDPVNLDPSSVKVLSSGAIIATVEVDPRVAAIYYNNQPLPEGSIIKNSTNGKKFIKTSGNYISYVSIEITPKVEWSWASGTDSAWKILQSK